MSQSNHQMNSQNLIYQPSTALLDSPSATSSASCNKQKKIKKHFIDFRSDTVTTPTQKMRKAMFKAAVGDDVYKDDPTVIKLQKYAADLFGKEAALYVPTGCMGNSCGLLGHTNRGQEIICADDCHIIQLERGFVS